jgi:uncharacterized protein
MKIAITILTVFTFISVSSVVSDNSKLPERPEDFKAIHIAFIKKIAEEGDVSAQIVLGGFYHDGLRDLVPVDKKQSFKWFQKAADQGNAAAQYAVGRAYSSGEGVRKSSRSALKWMRKAAEQGYADAQFWIGESYRNGYGGVRKNIKTALQWVLKAAEQNNAAAQCRLGAMYSRGDGVAKNEKESFKWTRKSAEQGYVYAQGILGGNYFYGEGVLKDEVEGYKWMLLAAAQQDSVKQLVESHEKLITPTQRAEGQRLARNWKPRGALAKSSSATSGEIEASRPSSTGTGFAITDDGYFITNKHVATLGATVRLLTSQGTVVAKVVKVDKATDHALLKADGNFTALPVASSRKVRLGATVTTVGFPNIGLQGFSPKLAKGEIASLAGAQDDARHFQISVPLQPGNSGGALVDARGNVIGVVVASLNQEAALATSGNLAQNVNYAVKSSYLLSFLESVPEVAAKLKDPNIKDRKFVDMVEGVQQATVLVLVY